MPMVIDMSKCDGCKKCDMVCPGDIIHMRPRMPDDSPNPLRLSSEPAARKKIEQVAYLKYESECWHCGSCRQDCPEDAIRVVFSPDMLSL